MPSASTSFGRRIRELETLTGLTAIDAIARVRALELRPAVEPCDASPDDHGVVLAQEPESGVKVTRGQLITLIVGEQQGSSAQSAMDTYVAPRESASPLELPDGLRLTRQTGLREPGTGSAKAEVATRRLAEPAGVTPVTRRPPIPDGLADRPEPRWQKGRTGRARDEASSERLTETGARTEGAARRRGRFAVAALLLGALLLAISAGVVLEGPVHRAASVQTRRRVMPPKPSSRDHLLAQHPAHTRASRHHNTASPARPVKPSMPATTSGIQGAGKVRSNAPAQPTLDARTASAPAGTQAIQTAAPGARGPVSPVGPLPGPPPTN
jgi:hypothetical protein